MTSNERESWIETIDATLSEWSQGDCTIGDDFWFVTRFVRVAFALRNPHRPLTPAAEDVAAETDLAESAVSGFVVVTQTCDLVRSCADRPFLEISPLVEVDADIRNLAEALTRKRSRFAFPDDFTSFAKKLQQRMQDKHEKASPEGEALRALEQIRVSATPAWDAENVELIFWFIRAEKDDRFQDKEWHEWLDSWLKLLPASGRFSAVDGSVVTLDDMTAKEYTQSDRLDLDRLSSR